jgi:hypothetical protein
MFAFRLVSRGLVAASTAAVLVAPAGQATARSRPLPPARGPVRVVRVTTLADSGPGSLRAAIRLADARGRHAVTVINFAMRGVIRLSSALPAIARTVVVSAESAPGHKAGGAPVVEIDCAGHAGLVFAPGSAGSSLAGLAVADARGAGVTLRASFVTVNHDYIGLSLAGRPLGNHREGIVVRPGSSRDRIGLNRSGDSGAVGNVISGNGGNGISLIGTWGNVVVANRIGTNPAGTAAIGNGGNGIEITGRSGHNEVGGTEFVDAATGRANNPTGSKGTVPPVFVVPPLGNLISGNLKAGVLITGDSHGVVLNGNFIGTTATGDAAIGNHGDGVRIDRANRNSLVGCRFVNNPFVYYNVVSGNGRNGLRIVNSNRTVVQGNFFGIGANNTAILANRLNGIAVQGASANTQVGGVIPLGNVASGNRRNGIAVTGKVRGFITFNTFGGLLAFKGAAPNGRDGLLITATGGDNLARTNVFSGNRGNGIEIGGNARGVTVDPDIVGLSTNGRSALPNGGDGLLIDGTAHGNIIGGTLRSVIPQDTFSGNDGYGIAITGRAHGNRVLRSFVGTAIFGLSAVGNRRGGILIGGHAYRNVIGFVLLRRANLISGNAGNGVTLLRGTSGNRVVRNFIGLDRFGRRLRNTGRQVLNLGARNVIVGNRLG